MNEGWIGDEYVILFEEDEQGVCQINCVSAVSVHQVQRHPVLAEHYLKRLERRFPVMNHLPVARRLSDRQIERLHGRFVIRKDPPVARQLA